MKKNRAILQGMLSASLIVMAIIIELLPSIIDIPDWVILILLAWLSPPMILAEQILSITIIIQILGFLLALLLFFCWGWLTQSLINNKKAAFIVWICGVLIWTCVGLFIALDDLLNSLL